MSARVLGAGAWLLAHAGVDHALAGDLAEACASGRSLIWYWRQALTAVAAAWVHTIADHKWLAARAVITGWVIWAAASLLTSYLRRAPVQHEWIVMAIALVRYGNWLVIGWAIGVLHRPYQLTMVLAYVGFALLMAVPAVSRTVVDVLGHPSYAPPSAPMILFVVTSLLAGGLLSAASIRHLECPSRATERPGR